MVETANSKWRPHRGIIPMLRMATCISHLRSPRMSSGKLQFSTDTSTISPVVRITPPKAPHTHLPKLAHLISRLRTKLTFKRVLPSATLLVDRLLTPCRAPGWALGGRLASNMGRLKSEQKLLLGKADYIIADRSSLFHLLPLLVIG